jgi:hypothetical protein
MNTTSKPYMIVKWQKYFDSSNPIITFYIKKYGFDFLKQSFYKIKNAYHKKLPYIIYIKFYDDDIAAVIYQTEYESALTHLLNLCIELEYYELCVDINSLLTSMKFIKPKRNRKLNKNQMVIK